VLQKEAAAAAISSAHRRSAGEAAGASAWQKMLRERYTAEQAALKDHEAMLAKMRDLDARYAAMPERTQARAVLRARTQLDTGKPVEAVETSLGPTAAALAQGLTTAEARAKAFHGTIASGRPHIEGYNKALGDMHSGLRGVASGFGQMSLTWGAIGPLLAGAALSHSFVQTIKQGAQVRQDLEALRVLSDESAASVSNLEASMLSLARTGPYGPREIAEAMKVLSLAGLSAAEVGKALKPTLDFAITGGVSIEKSAESLVAIGTAYGYQADQFSTVADAVSKAAAISMSSVDGMMQSFKASSIVAQAYGVSLKDAATAQALLANIGIRGSAAGTAMRQMYSELSGATASTRVAMQRLGVEVVEQSGKMKPLLTIMQDLSKALSGLSGPGRIAAIQALSNERGSKSIVASLVAVESKAKEVGSTASNELERIRQLIETSAGFNAIAAAQLSTTPLNLMKGVGASFEAALMESFKALEPVLILTAGRLREVFNSPEFRDGITWIVTAMGTFTSTLIDNLGALKLLAYAYASFKGVQLLHLALAAGAVALGLLNKELVFTAAGIMSAGAAATVAAPAVTGLARAAGYLGVALRVAGPLAIALTVAAAAWELYNHSRKSDGDKAAEANAKRQDLTLEALTEEAKRLDLVTTELKKGTSARLAEIRAKEMEAASNRSLEDEKQRSPLRDAAASADAQLKFAELSAAAEPSSRNSQILEIRRAAAKTASNKLSAFDSGVGQREAAISFQQQVVKSLQAEVNMRKELEDAANGRKVGTEPWKTSGQLSGELNHSASELALLKKNFDEQEKEAQTAYKRQMELLDLSHKGKLISDGAYTYQSEQYSEQLYSTSLRNLEKYIQDSKSLIATLKADPKKNVKGQSYIDELEADQRQALSLFNHQQAVAKAKEASRGGAMLSKVDTDLSKLRESVDLQEAKYQADLRTLGLTPGLVAAEQAVAAARAAGTAALRPLVDEIIQAQIELNSLQQAEQAYGKDHGMAADQNDRVAKLQAYADSLKAQLAARQGGVESDALRSGAAAKRATDFSGEAWRKYVEQGQNAYTVLETSRNSFMQGWVDSGRTIWETWLTTGKVSITSLRQLFMKTLADISYQMLILKPFSQLGEGVFNTAFKPAIEYKGAMTSGSDTASITAFDSALTKAGYSLYEMLAATGDGLAALLAGAGQGGTSNIVQAIARGFGGQYNTGTGLGSGSTGEFLPGTTTVGPYALGGAFNGQAQFFAKGSIFNSPHAFKFGRGASQLGIMGEAGPEAIMPLTRGAGGELGVRAHGGGQKSAGTSIVIENYGNGEQPQVTKESKPDGSEMIRVVLNATAKDISRGGAVRKSIQGAVKTTPNLPRY
jgi:TP901 family phage tail tape measure protein